MYPADPLGAMSRFPPIRSGSTLRSCQVALGGPNCTRLARSDAAFGWVCTAKYALTPPPTAATTATATIYGHDHGRHSHGPEGYADAVRISCESTSVVGVWSIPNSCTTWSIAPGRVVGSRSARSIRARSADFRDRAYRPLMPRSGSDPGRGEVAVAKADGDRAEYLSLGPVPPAIVGRRVSSSTGRRHGRRDEKTGRYPSSGQRFHRGFIRCKDLKEGLLVAGLPRQPAP